MCLLLENADVNSEACSPHCPGNLMAAVCVNKCIDACDDGRSPDDAIKCVQGEWGKRKPALEICTIQEVINTGLLKIKFSWLS